MAHFARTRAQDESIGLLEEEPDVEGDVGVDSEPVTQTVGQDDGEGFNTQNEVNYLGDVTNEKKMFFHVYVVTWTYFDSWHASFFVLFYSKVLVQLKPSPSKGKKMNGTKLTKRKYWRKQSSHMGAYVLRYTFCLLI